MKTTEKILLGGMAIIIVMLACGLVGAYSKSRFLPANQLSGGVASAPNAIQKATLVAQPIPLVETAPDRNSASNEFAYLQHTQDWSGDCIPVLTVIGTLFQDYSDSSSWHILAERSIADVMSDCVNVPDFSPVPDKYASVDYEVRSCKADFRQAMSLITEGIHTLDIPTIKLSTDYIVKATEHISNSTDLLK